MKELIKRCPSCGSTNQSGADECLECDEDIEFVNPEYRVEEASAQPDQAKYTPGRFFRVCPECGHRNRVSGVHEFVPFCQSEECRSREIMRAPVEAEVDEVRSAKVQSPRLALMEANSRHTVLVPEEGAVLGKRGDLDSEFLRQFRYISDFHCRIYQRGGEWYLKDLGSTNGTFAHSRGEPVEAYSELSLRTLRSIRLGDVVFEVSVVR